MSEDDFSSLSEDQKVLFPTKIQVEEAIRKVQSSGHVSWETIRECCFCGLKFQGKFNLVRHLSMDHLPTHTQTPLQHLRALPTVDNLALFLDRLDGLGRFSCSGSQADPSTSHSTSTPAINALGTLRSSFDTELKIVSGDDAQEGGTVDFECYKSKLRKYFGANKKTQKAHLQNWLEANLSTRQTNLHNVFLLNMLKSAYASGDEPTHSKAHSITSCNAKCPSGTGTQILRPKATTTKNNTSPSASLSEPPVPSTPNCSEFDSSHGPKGHLTAVNYRKRMNGDLRPNRTLSFPEPVTDCSPQLPPPAKRAKSERVRKNGQIVFKNNLNVNSASKPVHTCPFCPEVTFDTFWEQTEHIYKKHASELSEADNDHNGAGAARTRVRIPPAPVHRSNGFYKVLTRSAREKTNDNKDTKQTTDFPVTGTTNPPAPKSPQASHTPQTPSTMCSSRGYSGLRRRLGPSVVLTAELLKECPHLKRNPSYVEPEDLMTTLVPTRTKRMKGTTDANTPLSGQSHKRPLRRQGDFSCPFCPNNQSFQSQKKCWEHQLAKHSTELFDDTSKPNLRRSQKPVLNGQFMNGHVHGSGSSGEEEEEEDYMISPRKKRISSHK